MHEALLAEAIIGPMLATMARSTCGADDIECQQTSIKACWALQFPAALGQLLLRPYPTARLNLGVCSLVSLATGAC